MQAKQTYRWIGAAKLQVIYKGMAFCEEHQESSLKLLYQMNKKNPKKKMKFIATPPCPPKASKILV